MIAANFNGHVLTDEGVEANVCVCVDDAVLRSMAERLGSPDFPLPLLENVIERGRYNRAGWDDEHDPEDDG